MGQLSKHHPPPPPYSSSLTTTNPHSIQDRALAAGPSPMSHVAEQGHLISVKSKNPPKGLGWLFDPQFSRKPLDKQADGEPEGNGAEAWVEKKGVRGRLRAWENRFTRFPTAGVGGAATGKYPGSRTPVSSAGRGEWKQLPFISLHAPRPKRQHPQSPKQ